MTIGPLFTRLVAQFLQNSEAFFSGVCYIFRQDSSIEQILLYVNEWGPNKYVSPKNSFFVQMTLSPFVNVAVPVRLTFSTSGFYLFMHFFGSMMARNEFYDLKKVENAKISFS